MKRLRTIARTDAVTVRIRVSSDGATGWASGLQIRAHRIGAHANASVAVVRRHASAAAVGTSTACVCASTMHHRAVLMTASVATRRKKEREAGH